MALARQPHHESAQAEHMVQSCVAKSAGWAHMAQQCEESWRPYSLQSERLPNANKKPELGDHLKAPPAHTLEQATSRTIANICHPGTMAGQFHVNFHHPPLAVPASGP